ARPHPKPKAKRQKPKAKSPKPSARFYHRRLHGCRFYRRARKRHLEGLVRDPVFHEAVVQRRIAVVSLSAGQSPEAADPVGRELRDVAEGGSRRESPLVVVRAVRVSDVNRERS